MTLRWECNGKCLLTPQTIDKEISYNVSLNNWVRPSVYEAYQCHARRSLSTDLPGKSISSVCCSAITSYQSVDTLTLSPLIVTFSLLCHRFGSEQFFPWLPRIKSTHNRSYLLINEGSYKQTKRVWTPITKLIWPPEKVISAIFANGKDHWLIHSEMPEGQIVLPLTPSPSSIRYIHPPNIVISWNHNQVGPFRLCYPIRTVRTSDNLG